MNSNGIQKTPVHFNIPDKENRLQKTLKLVVNTLEQNPKMDEINANRDLMVSSQSQDKRHDLKKCKTRI